MLCSRLLLACIAMPFVWSSFVDEETLNLVQLTVERNWKRGKLKPDPAKPAEAAMENMEDDISFVQTQVTNEHRIKSCSDHSVHCHHIAAGVTPDGDVGVAEEGSEPHRDRPPLEMDDTFSFVQTKADHHCRSADCGNGVDIQSLDELHDDDTDAEAMGVSLLQTKLHVARRPVEHNSALSVALEKQPEPPAERSDAASSAIAPSDGEKSTWLGRLFERLAVRSWELHEWLSFALCLLVLECVVWKATQTGGLKSKDLRMMRSWGASNLPTSPKRLSLTLPLRQLLDPNGGPVKLFGSADGLAYMATLLQDDESGERTLQLSNAAEPTQAVMSVGPLPRSVVFEEGAAVHHYTTGCTLGALQSNGPDSWSLSKNGQTTLRMSSAAPFTLAISMNDPEAKEIAWVKPLSEAKEPDYVDLSICECGDPMLQVACAVAVLVASSKCPVEQQEPEEDF